MNPIIPEWPACEEVKAFSTLRYGGFSVTPYHGDTSGGNGLNFGLHVGDATDRVLKNRALLREWLPSEPVWLNQVHGVTVVDATVCMGVPLADASFTCEKGIVCVVMTADCLPVLLCTADGKAVAAAHAGWRGLSAGVLENTIAALRKNSRAEIMAWLGPAIGRDAFEVGEDVLEAFVRKDSRMAKAFRVHEGRVGKYLADIYELARLVLEKEEVVGIYGGGLCTVSETERFYSYRRDGITGRMATGIWIAPH